MAEAQPVVMDESRTWRAAPVGRRTLVIGGALIGAVASYMIGRQFLEESAARALAVFVVAAVFWATEVLPLFATALLVVAMQVVFLATQGGLAIQFSELGAKLGLAMGEVRPVGAGVFFAPFASDIIMLFLGGFLLSAAIVKHGVDSAAAAKMLGPFSKSPAMLMGGVMGVSAFFSMWMSNTACAAMMVAIVHPIAARLRPGSRLGAGLMIAAAFGANIGGIGTPIGSPPNAIAFEALRRSGFPITFIDWMAFGLPLAVMILIATWVVLVRMFPAAEGETVAQAPTSARISRRGWMTITIGVITIALWLTGGVHGLSSGAVALLAAAALTAFGLLDRKDVDSIDWNVLILIWGGLAISEGMQRSGLGDAIASLPVEQLPGGQWMFGVVIAVLAIGLSTFMSNTAAAGLLVPMALAFGIEGQENLAIVAALACSFSMALPVSTPPNAIAYATGRVPLSAMVRAGVGVAIVGVGAIALGFRIVLPMVLGSGAPAAP